MGDGGWGMGDGGWGMGDGDENAKWGWGWGMGKGDRGIGIGTRQGSSRSPMGASTLHTGEGICHLLLGQRGGLRGMDSREDRIGMLMRM